jgi:UrcA family protein
MTLASLKLNDFRRTSATLAALAGCLIVGTAHAASPDAAPSVRVPYGDLNLNTERGANTLYARIAAAARQVCAADSVDLRNLQAYAAMRSCETQAIANAVHAVPAPKVAARFAARHEHS